jgi:mycothiol synthase
MPMDGSMFSVRPFADSDYESFAEVRTAARPNYPVSAETLRHWDKAAQANLVHDRYVAELRQTRQVVAVGGLGADAAYPRKHWIFLFVRPEHQNRGIGIKLYDLLLNDARRQDGVCLRTSVQTGEAAGLAFSAHRGFVERARDWQSILDVQTADTSRLPSLLERLKAGGIEVTTLAKEGAKDPDVWKRLYGLDVATSPDVPRMDPFVPWTLEQFAQAELEGSSVLPEAWFIAKNGGNYVADSWAQREVAEPDLLQQDFTGTLKEYRRRGLALTLKLCLIDYARRNGFRRIRTNNNSLNVPMWKLNEQLGFRKISTTLQLEKPLN